MGINFKLENIKPKFLKERYKVFRGYRFDRLIFNVAMYLIFGYLFFVAYHYDFQMDYFNCPENPEEAEFSTNSKFMLGDFVPEVKNGMCKNPFYKNTWKNQEYVPPGEYGFKPGPLVNWAWGITLIIMGLAFAINHFVHNRKIKIELEGEP